MAGSSHDTGRIWLLPLSILAGVALSIFVLTHLVDAAGSANPRRVLELLVHPNPASAASTLANAGEIVAAVLAIALTVVAIIVELASNRYTHRVTELFVNEPVNFAIMGLFVVTALQGVWVTMTFDYTPGQEGGFVPYAGIAVSMGLLTLCLLVLIPYFNFVFAYLNPIRIVERISAHTLAGVTAPSGRTVKERQREAVRGIEQLADVALNAMQNRDKAVSMAALDALGDLMRDYQPSVGGLPDGWFVIDGELAHNPDFVSMDAERLAEIGERRIWFEMKILRQYQMVYGEALNRMRDLNYLIAINTRLLAEDAIRERRREQLHLLMKFFNTYLRAAINAGDVRTLYNVLHQYRMLAQALIDHRDGTYAIEVARYFKYYGLLAYHAHLPFILETVAYDLCTLCEYAHERRRDLLDGLLKIVLTVDRSGEGPVQEASLRGVRKAQVKLATFFLVADDEAMARTIHDDMAGEDPHRMASIRDELFSTKSPEYWEVIDRGANFDYLPPERRATLARFFGWFSGLPSAQPSQLSNIPAAPGEEAG